MFLIKNKNSSQTNNKFKKNQGWKPTTNKPMTNKLTITMTTCQQQQANNDVTKSDNTKNYWPLWWIQAQRRISCSHNNHAHVLLFITLSNLNPITKKRFFLFKETIQTINLCLSCIANWNPPPRLPQLCANKKIKICETIKLCTDNLSTINWYPKNMYKLRQQPTAKRWKFVPI